MKVNSEEWKEWLGHPVTQIFREYMQELLVSIRDDWAAGVYTDPSAEGTAQKNAVALGQYRQIEDLLNVDEESL
jgi:hypothetical protein